MKYIITRTSLVFDDDVQPCDHAIFDKDLEKWIIEIQDIHKFLMYCEKMQETTKKPFYDWYWGAINLSFDKQHNMFEIEIIDDYQG